MMVLIFAMLWMLAGVLGQAPATREQQDAIVALAGTDPVGAARQADALPYIKGVIQGGDLWQYNLVADVGNSQLPWNAEVPFFPIPSVNGSDESGWAFLPEIESFTLNRTFPVRGEVTFPFYHTANYDARKIKRAVMVMPGKPRDCWKYTTLLRNAMSIVVHQGGNGASNETVLLLGMCWLNQNDKTAGAVKEGELYFHNSAWEEGGHSLGPAVPVLEGSHHKAGVTQTNLSSYEVLDRFMDWLFDKQMFPALNRVVLVGHSLGGQCIQRYAMLKKTKAYDPNMMYWIGNPGSMVFPSDASRPYPNASCIEWSDWPYGLSNVSSIPRYARKDVNASTSAVVDRYRSRSVHYAWSLLDNGQGDTHCPSMMQGWNHLDRGCQFIFALNDLEAGFPKDTHTVDFVANTTHQDYPMLSTNVSLWRLFNDRYDTAEPLLTDISNPGDRLPRPHKDKSKKKFVTPGNTLLASVLLYGSVGFVLLSFVALPLLFGTSNFEDEPMQERKGSMGPLFARQGSVSSVGLPTLDERSTFFNANSTALELIPPRDGLRQAPAYSEQY